MHRPVVSVKINTVKNVIFDGREVLANLDLQLRVINQQRQVKTLAFIILHHVVLGFKLFVCKIPVPSVFLICPYDESSLPTHKYVTFIQEFLGFNCIKELAVK